MRLQNLTEKTHITKIGANYVTIHPNMIIEIENPATYLYIGDDAPLCVVSEKDKKVITEVKPVEVEEVIAEVIESATMSTTSVKAKPNRSARRKKLLS
jgi:hypothetical protein